MVSRRGLSVAEQVDSALNDAQALAKSGKRPDAYKKYREVLEQDPIHPEALSWVQDYLRTKRRIRAAFRDVAPRRGARVGRVAGRSAARPPARSGRALREQPPRHGRRHRRLEAAPHARSRRRGRSPVADPDARADAALGRARESLRTGRERREIDLEKKRSPSRRSSPLFTRPSGKTLAAAARGLGAHRQHDARRRSGDRDGVSKMFAKTGALDRAAQVIASNAPSVTDEKARSALLERLGELYEGELDDPARAGEGLRRRCPRRGRRGEALGSSSERCFVASERWERAGQAAVERGAEREADPKTRSAGALCAQRGLSRAGRRRRRIAREPGPGRGARSHERRVRAAARRPVHVVSPLGRSRAASAQARRPCGRSQEADESQAPGRRPLRKPAGRHGRCARDLAWNPR